MTSFVCESEMREKDEGVFVPLRNVEGAQKDPLKWHGRTTVSDHLPVRNHGTTRVCASAKCLKALKNMHAVLRFTCKLRPSQWSTTRPNMFNGAWHESSTMHSN